MVKCNLCKAPGPLAGTMEIAIAAWNIGNPSAILTSPPDEKERKAKQRQESEQYKDACENNQRAERGE